MWKRCSEGRTGADCLTFIGSGELNTWKEALDLSIDLNNNSGYAGYNNWRVPNIDELRSIAAINCYNPTINEIAFPNTPKERYWSSSPVANFPNFSWTIKFNYGVACEYYDRSDYSWVRLVRSVQ